MPTHLPDHASQKTPRSNRWLWFAIPAGIILLGVLAYFGPLMLILLQFGSKEENGWSYFMADYSEATTSRTIEFSDQTVEFVLTDYQGPRENVNVQVIINGTLVTTFSSYQDKDFWADFPAFEYGIRQDLDGDRQEDLIFEVRSGIYYISSRGGELHTLKEPLFN